MYLPEDPGHSSARPWRLPATGIGEMNCSRFPGGGSFDIRIEFGEEFV